MTCPGCGFDPREDFAFCPKCGRKLPAACPACGFACASDFAFCPKCGAALVGPHRRRATATRGGAAAGDHAGSGGGPRRRPPPGDRALRRSLRVHRARRAARSRGGARVPERAVRDAGRGDRALRRLRGEVRGRCRAWRSSARRSRTRTIRSGRCDAALDMLERSATLSRQWAARLGQPVTLHIGVHTGPVVAGSLGDAAGGAYAVTGDTVNTTARLLAAARARRRSWCPRATYALTQHRFAFEPAGELALGASRSRSCVHRLLGALAGPADQRAGWRRSGSRRRWSAGPTSSTSCSPRSTGCSAGRAQVVSLVGEAGTGKSRLIAEFFARLEADGRLAGDASAAPPARRWASRPTASSARSSATPTRWIRGGLARRRPAEAVARAPGARRAATRRRRPSRRC